MKILKVLAILFPLSAFVAASAAAMALDVSYEFVVDLSGSMNRYEQGASLKAHAIKALSASLPESRPYAVRVFGHRVGLQDRAASCADSELIFPFERHDVSLARARLSGLLAQGYTPLAKSLQAIENDLAKTPGKHVVILLSDGIDSCDGDPAGEIEKLKAHGLDIIVNPIGLGLDAAARAQLEEIANITGGKFTAVSNPSLLSQAFIEALSHIEGTEKPRSFPEDIGAGRDAGGTIASALPVKKGEWQTASVGTRRGAARDEADYFAIQSGVGEKFEVQLELLSGRLLSASVLDDSGFDGGSVLATASESSPETEPITAPQRGGKVYIRFTTADQGEVRYRFKIISLVEIDP